MTVRLRFAVLAIAASFLGLTAWPAIAAPAQIERVPTKLADAGQTQPVPVAEDDDTATCSRSRKRLWVEGEGWIIRRVTICR